MQDSRQTAAQDRQAGRQSTAHDRQASRQNYAHQRQENRQDWADDYHGHGYGYRGYYPGGAYAAGAVAVTYYQSGSTWYQPVYEGREVTYVVVQPTQ